jgi:hypothetical protein
MTGNGVVAGIGVGVGMVAGAAQALKSIAAKITDMSKIRFIITPLFVSQQIEVGFKV